MIETKSVSFPLSGLFKEEKMSTGTGGGNTPGGGTPSRGEISNSGRAMNPSESLNENEAESRKRKANESPEISPGKENVNKKRKGLRREMIVAVEAVSEAIQALCFDVMEYKNTKNTIKEQAEKLKELNRTKMEFLKKALMESKLDPGEEEEDTEIGKKYFCDRCSVTIEKAKEEREVILQKIKDADSLPEEEYNKLMNAKWPIQAYAKTKVVTGNPLSTKCEHLIVCYDDNTEDSTLMKIVKEKYPEAEEVLGEAVEEGKVTFLESIINTSKGTHKKRIYFAKSEEDKKMKEKLTYCRSQMGSVEATKIAVAVSETKKRNKIRKSLELSFYNKNDEIEFYVPQGESESKKERPREEAVVIGTNVTTYADTLRNIRAVVNPDDLGIEIKTVKLTRDKKVVIITKEGQAEALHKEISTKITGIETRVSGRNSNTVFLILDIDASINGKEVEDFIRKSTKVYATEVKHLRTARSGTQVATVSMPSHEEENLIRGGVIKIGWTHCRVKPKIDILRCYNCLNLGHHSDICTEERCGKKCLNCAQTGHLIRECKNLSFCTTCNKQGHKSDSTNCPTYKRRVQDATSSFYQKMATSREIDEEETTANSSKEQKTPEDVDMGEDGNNQEND